MVLHKDIEVRDSKIAGKGLYAKAPIKAGTIVWEAEPDEKKYWMTLDQINQLPEDERKRFWNWAYEVDEGVWSSIRDGQESDKGEFMNHSCSPKCIFINDDLMVALVDIHPDEEVTYDYACSETSGSSHMPFPCACGTAACRGKITGYDGLRLDVRLRYGHFQFTSRARKWQGQFAKGEIKVPEGMLPEGVQTCSLPPCSA